MENATRFSHEELTRAFNAVTDQDDWRGPISAWVNGEAVLLVVEAVKFFTATVPTVELNQQTMQYLISSVGYRMGPAGDH